MNLSESPILPPSYLFGGPYLSKDNPYVFGSDEYWMHEALLISMKSIGKAAPNPPVGCVFVKDGKEIGRGATQDYGGLHAEAVVLKNLRETNRWHLAEGASVFVTLEPCSHFGKQPPCVEGLIDAKIGKCIVGISDPNRLVGGGGMRKLIASGIQVRSGILEQECRAWLSPFLKTIEGTEIFIALKWAQSIDAKLHDASGNSQWISGKDARAYTHWLRQKYDAIVVGGATVVSDFPRLSVRDCLPPINRNPVKVIVDWRGRVGSIDKEIQRKLDETTFASPEKVIVFHPKSSTSTLWFEGRQNIMLIESRQPDPTMLVEILKGPRVTEFLGKSLQSMMIEGGPQLLNFFLQADLWDALHVFIAPTILGGSRNAIGDFSEGAILLRGSKNKSLSASARFGKDLLVEILRP